MTKFFVVLLLTILSFFSTRSFAYQVSRDTLTREQFIHLQTIKSDTLNQIAMALAIPGASNHDLNEAISMIMKGLHNYSRFRDSIGLRQTFDHLAFVYHLQKKYVQAKWFYIQSNTLAREMKDTANIIHSLLSLSSVKADIKDYSMANRDLAEAIALSKTQNGIEAQLEVQNSLVTYYTNKGDTKKATLAADRIEFLKDSVAKPIVRTKNIPVEIKKPVVINKPAPVIIEDNSGRLITIGIVVIFILLLIIFYIRYKRNLTNRKSGEFYR